MPPPVSPASAAAAQPPTDRRWQDLDEAAQTALLEAYGHWLDGLPPTCSMQTKVERFRAWLAARGVEYAACPAGRGHESPTP